MSHPITKAFSCDERKMAGNTNKQTKIHTSLIKSKIGKSIKGNNSTSGSLHILCHATCSSIVGNILVSQHF